MISVFVFVFMTQPFNQISGREVSKDCQNYGETQKHRRKERSAFLSPIMIARPAPGTTR